MEPLSNRFVIDPSIPKPKQLEDLRDTLGKIVAETVQQIAKQTEEAQQNCTKDRALLNRAIWYPVDYAQALLADKQTKRLTWLQNNRRLHSGFLDVTFFSPIVENGKRNHWEFVIKDGKSPSEALTKAIAGLSILDCGTVCQIARYKALLQILGKEKFNRLFQKAHGEPLCVSYDDNERQPMRYFVSFTDSAKAKNPSPSHPNYRHVKIGQVVSFNNHSSYSQRHINGMGGNYNAVCLDETRGKQRFIAHGIPPKGASEEEFCQFLADKYNEDPGAEALRGSNREQERLKMAVSLGRMTPNITPDQVPGLDIRSPQDFNVELINDLVKLPLEEVSMSFVKKHPQTMSSLDVIQQQENLMRMGAMMRRGKLDKTTKTSAK